MNQLKLQKIIESAKPCANIALTFSRYTPPGKLVAVQVAAATLEHFAKTGRIVIVRTDRPKSMVIITKTLIFKPQDAPELTRNIAEFVVEAEARDIPDFSISLQCAEAEPGWELIFDGGNKLLRTFFKACGEFAIKYFGFDATVLSDSGGCTVLDLSAGNEDKVLEFSEHVAGMFKVPLIF